MCELLAGVGRASYQPQIPAYVPNRIGAGPLSCWSTGYREQTNDCRGVRSRAQIVFRRRTICADMRVLGGTSNAGPDGADSLPG